MYRHDIVGAALAPPVIFNGQCKKTPRCIMVPMTNNDEHAFPMVKVKQLAKAMANSIKSGKYQCPMVKVKQLIYQLYFIL